MTHQRLIAQLQQTGASPTNFDHFDYVEAFQKLPELDAQAHPRRRRLAQEFASRCLIKIEAEERVAHNAEKCRNFLQRMKVHESMRQEKLEAMRYIQERYDSKCGQLRFYPKVNGNLATQKGRFWKDRDGLQAIQHQSAIHTPNSSTFSDNYTYPD